MSVVQVSTKALNKLGIEAFPRGSDDKIALPRDTILEAPSSLKRTPILHSLRLGAFSYQVSGYCFAARIGRYCSFGENVQIGRQDHPLTWATTSPALYRGGSIFNLSGGFRGAKEYGSYQLKNSEPPTRAKITTIGNDVWIGHAAMIKAGVNIGDGAVIAAGSIVTKDVPPYAIVAGSPAAVKRFRLPDALIKIFLDVKWWRFAPWQISHLDAAKPESFISGVAKLNPMESYPFSVVNLQEF